MHTKKKQKGSLIMIDFNTFRALYEDAKTCDSEAKYVMERRWEDWMSEIADTDKIADVLCSIYTMTNGGFAEIVRQYKNMRQMCEVLCIPYSTAQKWSVGHQKPASYLLMLMVYATVNYDKMHKSE